VSPHWNLLISLFVLLVLANGAPLLLALLSGGSAGRPMDGGLVLWDGYPLFGKSKTWRGLIAALVVTPLGAWLLGLGWGLGLVVALGAMAGDLIASFIKRRMGLPSSASVPLLDHVPETLIPVLLVAGVLRLDWLDLGVLVLGFAVMDLLFTALLERSVRGRKT
jgi:CDP-2,3-bis-(O-geranylgeranyl)-sn-glycerol synthase